MRGAPERGESSFGLVYRRVPRAIGIPAGAIAQGRLGQFDPAWPTIVARNSPRGSNAGGKPRKNGAAWHMSCVGTRGERRKIKGAYAETFFGPLSLVFRHQIAGSDR